MWLRAHHGRIQRSLALPALDMRERGGRLEETGGQDGKDRFDTHGFKVSIGAAEVRVLGERRTHAVPPVLYELVKRHTRVKASSCTSRPRD